MDVARKRPKPRWWLRSACVAVAIAVGSWAWESLASLEHAVASIDRSSLSIGVVRRGTMVREVYGTGSLVPVDSTWLTARVGGQIKEVAVQPGVEIERGAVLMRLFDPALERAVSDAERAWKACQADLERFRLQLAKERLDLKWNVAEAEALHKEAKSQAVMDGALFSKGLIPERQWDLSENRAAQKQKLLEIQVERAGNQQMTGRIEEAQKVAAVETAAALLSDSKDEFDALTVRASVRGILQQLGPSPLESWQVGQRVTTGAVLAKIVDPVHLKATMRVSETDARDVGLGQRVAIDTRTRNGIIPGRVMRIDPSAQGATVAVDVELEGKLPKGARPDLTIDGTIEVERLEDVLYVDRPMYSQPHASQGLFVLRADELNAVRTNVKFGQCSISTIELREGLQAGDRLVLSDMSKWDGVDRVRVK